VRYSVKSRLAATALQRACELEARTDLECSSRRREPSGNEAPVVRWWARAMPRRGSTCGRREKDKEIESIPDPKGRESRSPTDFPLHNSVF
jgi:hypothetical protein